MFAQVLNCSSSYFRQINPINKKEQKKNLTITGNPARSFLQTIATVGLSLKTT
jgi:hypothetical protein